MATLFFLWRYIYCVMKKVSKLSDVKKADFLSISWNFFYIVSQNKKLKVLLLITDLARTNRLSVLRNVTVWEILLVSSRKMLLIRLFSEHTKAFHRSLIRTSKICIWVVNKTYTISTKLILILLKKMSYKILLSNCLCSNFLL